MKKIKLYAKKTLSVFMAVMMLMTAWVFVAPEKASAYPQSATVVAATNTNALADVTGGDTVVTANVFGQWPYPYSGSSDWNLYTEAQNKTVYKNVIYSKPFAVATSGASESGNTSYASGSSEKTTLYSGTFGSNSGRLYCYNAITTLVYDGVNTPSTAIMFMGDGDASNSTIGDDLAYQTCYITGANGFSLKSAWKGSDGSPNFNYVWHSLTNQIDYTSNHANTSLQVQGKKNQHFYGNIIHFTGSMDDNTYYTACNPIFNCYLGTGNYEHMKTLQATSNNPLYVINIVPWNKAVAAATNVYNDIAANPAKYTTASVAEYVTLASNLLKANANNYINSSVNNVTGWASAAQAAVSAWNNWSGLKIQQYRVTFQKDDGEQYYYTRDYGSSFDFATIAATHPNTAKSLDDQRHQTYMWDSTKYVTTIVDDITINEIVKETVDHTYGDYTQTETQHSRTCTVCSYVQSQNHIKGTGYVTQTETCTEDGVMTYDCAVCGKTAITTSVINNISGHDFRDIAIKEDGENGSHWRKCSRCDVYGWNGVADACENHNWDKNADGVVDAGDAETKASTCIEAGFEKYTCKVCSATWTKTLDLAAHTITATAAKNVTTICGGDGNAAFWSCSVCNKVWKDEALTDELTDTTDADSDGIPDALETKGPEHSFTGAYVSFSGGENGTHHRQCARFTQCKTYGPEEKHTWGEPVVTPATCEKEGKEVYTCTSGCGQTYEKTLDKADHLMTKIVAVAAVCGTPGNNEYYSCSTCNKYYKDEAGTTVTTVEAEKIPALNHTCTGHHEGDKLVTKATCTAKAVYKNTCDYCGQEVSGTHTYGEVDDVNGHDYTGNIKADAENNKHTYLCKNGCDTYGNETDCEYVETAETDSTCKTKGYITYKCTTCENGYTTEKDLDPENHEGATEVRDAAAATCMTPGYTGNTYCLGCGKIKSAGTEIPVDKTNHENMKDYDQVNSTCQTEGYKAYRYCDKCGTYEIAKEAIAKKNHSFTEYTTNNNGTHTANCNTCKAENGEVATDTKACTGGTANCQSAAICTVCNAPYGQIDENTHVNQEFVAKTPATCQKEGHEAYYKCADCDKTIGEIETIPVIAHTFGKWSKVDGQDKHTRSCTTCKADVAEVATETLDCAGGIAYCNKLAECATCKATYGEFDPDNHSTEANTLKDVVDATCQAPGFTGNYYYDCCNELKQAGTATEQLAHTFDIEVEGTRVAATCIAKGEVTYKCSTCVESEGVAAATQKKELAIDTNNHATPNETVVKNQKAATCEEDGHTGDVYYKCCYVEGNTAEQNKKALKEKGTTIKANGQHVYGEAIPEYMAVITTDDNGVKTLGKKDAEPDYDAKVAARRADNKWYHFAQCTICGVITEDACYTYEHTFNCVGTDECEICKGLCSLIDENVHANIIKIEGKDATHTEDGYKAYYQCADCKKYFLDDAGKKGFDPESEEGKKLITISKDTVPCTEWEEEPYETKDPTCDEDGYKKYHCVIEGCTKVKTEIIPSAGVAHKWAADYKVIKEATCGTVGYKAIYCEVCKAMKPNSASTIPATGEHNYVLNEDKTVVGTSCSDPTIKYYECTCGAYKTETVYEGNSEHDWSEWVTIGGDCSTGVVQESVCSACGEKKQQTISEGEHSYVVYVRVEPTPEKDGYVIYECENCKVKTEPETLKYEGPENPDNHLVDYTQYRVVSEKTCTMAEQREYTCIRCGEKLVYAFGELADHYWLEQPAEIATCERDGHSAYYRCVVCLEERGKEVYKATGHADNDADGKCDECNSAFYNDGKNQCGCICHKEGWFMQFIYKIVNFFWKLFKINHSCACGAVHY